MAVPAELAALIAEDDRKGELGEVPDEEMIGMTVDEQKWYVVQKGFAQVQKFCDEIGLPQYYELFLQNRYGYADQIRRVTQKELVENFKLTDDEEIESILSHSADLAKDPEITTFIAKYGEPTLFITECEQGKRWLAERAAEGWFQDNGEDKDDTEMTFEEKWRIAKADFENFSAEAEGVWATASSCDGFIFLWPLERPLDNPPCQEERVSYPVGQDEEGVAYPGCVRAAYCHPYVCTDFCMDWERMVSMSCGGDCRVVIYDMEQAKIKQTIRNDKGVEISQAYICIDGDVAVGKVAVGTCNGPIKIGDAEIGKIVQVLKGHDDDVYDVKAEWDQNLIVAASWDHTLSMFDLRSGKRTRTMEGHTVVLNRVDVSFERMLCVSFAAEQPMKLWDLKDGRCVKTLEGHWGGNNDGVVNWNTYECVTGGEDGLVKIWDLQTGECKRTFDCDHIQTLALDVNWEKGWLLTGSWDYKIRVWDLQTGQKYQELRKPRRTCTQVAIKGGRGSG